MKLTLDQTLQKGIQAHKAGRVQEADRLYTTILKVHPNHPDANHNMGVLAAGIGKVQESIPFFKTALEANPKIEQFWISYIDALIKDKQFEDAKQVLEQRKKRGVLENQLNILEEQLVSITEKEIVSRHSPSQKELSSLLEHYQNGRFSEAEKLAVYITHKFPTHQLGWKVLGAVLKQTGRISDSETLNKKVVELSPMDADAHYNLGNTLKELGKFEETEASYNQAIALNPDYAEAHNNLGVTLQELGRLDEAEANMRRAIELKSDSAEFHYNLGNILQEVGRFEEAEASCNQAIELKPDYAEAFNNLGVILQELGRLDDAKASFTQAIELKPNYANAFWNLSGNEETIIGSEHWIDKCLIANTDSERAKLTKAALRFYQGDRERFDNLIQSKFKEHPWMRSFSWAFSLANLPELHFNRWCFFDAIIKKSITSKPFYEFGVWRASSFKYLIKSFKKGYGFDTFTGLPEDWDIGSGLEKKGTYSSDGIIPKIRGGEFIVGKFEDTLPVFFSENRPIASVINFDADLYSSTICALNFSKSVIDKDTILIFDEFIMNESWEQDEFKALNEFCSINLCSYEVIAISFKTKQVAVKLIDI